MRNISFAFTKDQFRARAKTVTRRMGWKNLKIGELLCGVEKGMGLKPGEKMVRLGVIRIEEVRLEKLNRMLEDTTYGLEECRLEGFRDHPQKRWPSGFVEFFCAANNCKPDETITRIRFSYVDENRYEGPEGAD